MTRGPLVEIGPFVTWTTISDPLFLLAVLRVIVVIQERIRIRCHVPVVQERVLLESDVDEGGLQVVLQVLHTPLEYAPDESFLLRMLDHEFLETSVLKDRDAGFELLDIDDDLSLHPRALQPVEYVQHFISFP